MMMIAYMGTMVMMVYNQWMSTVTIFSAHTTYDYQHWITPLKHATPLVDDKYGDNA